MRYLVRFAHAKIIGVRHGRTVRLSNKDESSLILVFSYETNGSIEDYERARISGAGSSDQSDDNFEKDTESEGNEGCYNEPAVDNIFE
jgi:hypothetical protein